MYCKYRERFFFCPKKMYCMYASKADALAHLKGIPCSKVSKADSFAHCNNMKRSKAEASKANAVLDTKTEKSKYTTPT